MRLVKIWIHIWFGFANYLFEGLPVVAVKLVWIEWVGVSHSSRLQFVAVSFPFTNSPLT